MRVLVAVTLAAIAGVGCAPTYAPPLRAAAYGTPARLSQGELEVGAALGGYAYPTVGGPRFAYAIRDWVAIESGTNLSFVDYKWALQYGGLRFSLKTPVGLDPLAPHVRFVGDLELGGALGAGGEHTDQNGDPVDRREWYQRVAGGAYQGIGFGLQIRWFSIYTRVRIEEAIARNVPLTLWPSAMLGLGFDIHHRVAIDLGGGYMGYFNRIDDEQGWFYQAAVTVFFDLRKGRRRDKLKELGR